jgi:hypothetical protein
MDDKELGAGKICFVVSPIGSKLEPVGSPGRLRYERAIQMWENVFAPACEIFGLEPIRADKIATPGEITKQVFTHLRDAEVVIADLSEGNANVMYELGLRHTRNKITLQVGEYEQLPFDVNTIRTTQFKRTEAGLIDARDALIRGLRAALSGDFSPVEATDVWTALDASLSPEEVQSAVNVSLEPDDTTTYDDDEPGRLELLVDGEVAMGGISELLDKLNVQIVEAGDNAVAHTPALETATSFAAKLTAVRKYAESVAPNAASMDELSNQFFGDVKQIDVMVHLIIDELNEDGLPSDPDSRESVVNYLESIVGLAEAASGSRPSMSEFRKSILDLRRQSKQLAAVSKSMEQSVTRIISGTDMITEWGELASPLLADALDLN